MSCRTARRRVSLRIQVANCSPENLGGCNENVCEGPGCLGWSDRPGNSCQPYSMPWLLCELGFCFCASGGPSCHYLCSLTQGYPDDNWAARAREAGCQCDPFEGDDSPIPPLANVTGVRWGPSLFCRLAWGFVVGGISGLLFEEAMRCTQEEIERGKLGCPGPKPGRAGIVVGSAFGVLGGLGAESCDRAVAYCRPPYQLVRSDVCTAVGAEICCLMN
jgi:hypothetical protein